MLGAVHDSELAEAVADNELEDVGRVRDEITGLIGETQAIVASG
jgi:hypothetical protein